MDMFPRSLILLADPRIRKAGATRHAARPAGGGNARRANLHPVPGRFLESEWTLAPVVAELFEAKAIKDDVLRMMFSCCHPRLPEAAQVPLILHILCGFSVGEIANAFVSPHVAIEKRITHAKKVLAGSKKLFDTAAPADFSARLPAVHRALYLLFNEGYHGVSAEIAVRADLCREAVRLTALLLEHPLGATPTTLALAALMCLGAARLPARVDASDNLISLLDQDRSQWDQDLVAEGLRFLRLTAAGADLTQYHVEAAIASLHGNARSTEETDWKAIVSLYDTLLTLCPSPIVALNRAIAVAQSESPERGLGEVLSINDCDRLAAYPFYFAAPGELELPRHARDRA
jgi:predicted RNA polymerase sigma factor